LLPTTQGIILLRSVILDGKPLGATWADGSLELLVLHSLFVFVLGWMVYRLCERVAKRKGSLGQY
jgi:hypothetical protein